MSQVDGRRRTFHNALLSPAVVLDEPLDNDWRLWLFDGTSIWARA